MTITVEELQEWDQKIQVLVQRSGLNCYPQEFEVCDHHDMIGYMAYSGMPSRYSHWSFGKTYERQKTMYDYGVSGLPYEMVINSDPCLAYLMRDNTLLLQILTIAHVYGHNDFFKNNFTFTSSMDARYTLERFKHHAKRIDSYIEDPSIGIELVEAVLDDAHALLFQCRRNLAIKHPDETFSDGKKKPTEDILNFIADHHPTMEDWKRDILKIVEEEGKYFIPQIETKIMNEGWASYWHYTIMQALELPQDLHFEFMVRHSQVLRPHPGSINPYHVGFVLWQEIEKEANGGENPSDPFVMSEGRKRMFQIRESDRDSSFLRRFLTAERAESLQLFQHEKRGTERVITELPDDEDSFATLKKTLLAQVGMGSFPLIKVLDGDYSGTRALLLRHEHDGRDLEHAAAEKTLGHIYRLWGRDVHLETKSHDKKAVLKFTSKGFKT